MSYSNRYSSRCSCSSQVKLFAQQRGVSCCNQCVTAPATPCCEPHVSIIKPGVCFRPTCSVAATYPDHFWIAFKNQCDQEIPIDLGTVFFYDQAAGFLNVHLFNGTSYEVSLVDATKVGQVIEEDACVLVEAAMDAGSVTTQRCLAGQFVAPALDATQTLYILNGSAIPVGSTVTFTAGGETGSYLVTAFISASGSIYAYTVENTGAGLTPGLIVDGGAGGSCLVPIEIVTNVDLCDLSEALVVDSLTGCLNSSPRAFVPAGDDYVPRGQDGQWDQAKFTNFDCCVFTEGCVKFSGDGCTEAQDTFVVADGVGIECLTAAWEQAGENNTIVTATISSAELTLPIIILNWDSGTRTMTAKPADDDYIPEGEDFVEFCDPGTPICLGECCRQCTWGPQTTDIFVADPEAPMTDSTWIVGPVSLAYDDVSPREYLVGYAFDTGIATSLEITSTYNDNAAPPTGKPFVTDPLVIRQKICNTHPNGCTQDAQLEYNYEIRVGGSLIPDALIIHWELGSFVSASDTLADNVTPNPYSEPSSQAAAAGQIVGTSTTQSNLDGTAIGFGGGTDAKIFPFTAGFFKDHAQLADCRCALCIVWFYVMLSPQASITPGSVSVTLALRRYIVKTLTNDIVLPNNDPDSQGWNS